MELYNFSTSMLRLTGEDEPTILRAPINDEGDIYVHHPKARSLPKLPLYVHVGEEKLIVERADQQPIQIIDGAPTAMSRMRNSVFIEPVSSIHYYRGPQELWVYDQDDRNFRNASLFKTFSTKICEWTALTQGVPIFSESLDD